MNHNKGGNKCQTIMVRLFKTILGDYTVICRQTSQRISQENRLENNFILMHLVKNV